MNFGVTGPGSERSLPSSTSKAGEKGSLSVNGKPIPVVNKTGLAESPITKAGKDIPSAPSRPPSKGTKAARHQAIGSTKPSSEASGSSASESGKSTEAPRQKGGTSAKRAATAAATGLGTSHQGTMTPADQATQNAIEAATSAQDYAEDSLAANLAESGLLRQQRRDSRETERKRRAGDAKTGKSEEEGEEGDEAKTGKVESVETAEEREGGSQGGGKHQELFDRLEQLAREGKSTGLPNIIDAAWGKNGIYEDVTEAYDGLRAAQQHFGEKDEELLKNLSNSTRAAGDVLYKENGPDIRTGYLFGPGTDETISYRESVVRFEKVSDSFKAIIEKVGGNGRLFTKEIDKLIKLIQIDLKAQESTLDPSHLKQIMQGLFKVQMCLQVNSESALLLRDMHNLYSAPPTTDN